MLVCAELHFSWWHGRTDASHHLTPTFDSHVQRKNTTVCTTRTVICAKDWAGITQLSAIVAAQPNLAVTRLNANTTINKRQYPQNDLLFALVFFPALNFVVIHSQHLTARNIYNTSTAHLFYSNNPTSRLHRC